jgi:peptidylprolyl isomerase
MHEILTATLRFDRVVEGMDVVQKVEAEGSRSGQPRSKITVKDCGAQA